MKNFGNSVTESIALPLNPSKKIDLRGSVPVKQCKVVTVNEKPVGLTSEEKAVREQIESNQRDLDKQKLNEDFLKKTKERLKEQRLKSAKNLQEIEKTKEPNLGTNEFNQVSFTFMDQLPDSSPKPSPEKQKQKDKPMKSAKTIMKPLKNLTIDKEAKPEALSATPKIPRFVSVDDMRKEFNPKMVKKSGHLGKNSTGLQETPIPHSTNSLSKTSESSKGLEQTRFSVALKTLVTSQMKNKSLNESPAVCTCGAASKHTPRHPKKCANNCPFYKRESEYQRALKQMLTSYKASE